MISSPYHIYFFLKDIFTKKTQSLSTLGKRKIIQSSMIFAHEYITALHNGQEKCLAANVVKEYKETH